LTSKKAEPQRHEEILNFLSPDIINFVNNNAEQLCATQFGADVFHEAKRVLKIK